MTKLAGHDLGAFLREQRQNAQLSLRQLSDLAGVSNPYLSQIERGLKKPSAEILQQLARGLQVSAESLYVRAGILDEDRAARPETSGVLPAIAADPELTERQRAVLVDVYQSFVGASAGVSAGAARHPAPRSATAPRRTTPRSSARTAATRRTTTPTPKEK